MAEVSILFLTLLVSFLACVVSLPLWIKKARACGLLWEDMNKPKSPKNVVASGGIIVIMSFALGVLAYIAIRTFVYGQSDVGNTELFALLSVILFLSIIGLVDDLLGWKNGGLSVKTRLVLSMVASIPLVVINAGESSVAIPFFGTVNFGIFYPLVVIPIAITATTTVYNFLAGFNGLEAGQGILILSFLSYVAYINNTSWLAVVGLCMVVSLIAFYFFNKVPAKVFPGDILTYAVGALIGGMAILGNFEKIAIIVFIPYIIEMILKVRGKIELKTGKFPQSFGVPQKDRSLNLRYDKIYGLTHFSLWFLKKLKNKVYEKDVVYFIFIIQIIFILIAFSLI